MCRWMDKIYNKDKAVIKFNGGLLAILCSSCRRIIKTGRDMTAEEISYVRGEIDLPPQYCDKCIKEKEAC